jgi:hypothetical protein
MFAWDDIPPTRYSQAAQNMGGHSNLGLLRISTDAGIEGHAFLFSWRTERTFILKQRGHV